MKNRERKGLSDTEAMELINCESVGSLMVDRIRLYTTTSGELINVRYSQLYDQNNAWYGISPNKIDVFVRKKVSYLCLIIGYEGVVKLPVRTLLDYIKNAYTSAEKHDPDKIRHYHLQIRFEDNDIVLHNKVDTISIGKYFFENTSILTNNITINESRSELLEKAKSFTDYADQYRMGKGPGRHRNESRRQKEIIAELENWSCQVCGFRQKYLNKDNSVRWIIHVDHIVEKSRGGGETIDNLLVLCPNCHAKKTYGVIIVMKDAQWVLYDGKQIQITDNHLGWASLQSTEGSDH